MRFLGLGDNYCSQQQAPPLPSVLLPPLVVKWWELSAILWVVGSVLWCRTPEYMDLGAFLRLENKFNLLNASRFSLGREAEGSWVATLWNMNKCPQGKEKTSLLKLQPRGHLLSPKLWVSSLTWKLNTHLWGVSKSTSYSVIISLPRLVF